MIILYDSIQEGYWFRQLHPFLAGARLLPFPSPTNQNGALKQVLSYDRPDIVLLNNDQPILVLERTVEVPTGHNVGQRFARLVAAAQLGIPVVYFGPYAAYKHGGQTQGPRYMNLRLFYALDKLAQIENTAVTVINWPVDQNFEIIQDPGVRDSRVVAYLDLFSQFYQRYNPLNLIAQLKNSDFQRQQDQERSAFIRQYVKKPKQYDAPPPSVRIISRNYMANAARCDAAEFSCDEVVLYKIGMTYIRSDPYSGMALLYSYLYCGGLENRSKNLILSFPNITLQMWSSAKHSNRNRKDIKLFTLAADGILFRDGYLHKNQL
jgi:hypothetical protein